MIIKDVYGCAVNVCSMMLLSIKYITWVVISGMEQASDGCEDMPMLLANNIMYNAFDIVHCVS